MDLSILTPLLQGMTLSWFTQMVLLILLIIVVLRYLLEALYVLQKMRKQPQVTTIRPRIQRASRPSYRRDLMRSDEERR